MVAQGTTLAGRYRLDNRLGAGGMGEVWRGEDVVLARTVAVKVLLPGRTDDPGFVARFQGEARAMATINHPGVVDVYDYGVTEVAGAGATAYLVMKFVDGEALDRLLSRLGRIGPEPAMELIAQAASALQAVHDQGIVHRDVKPGNLMVRQDGTLVLTDFGIARSDVGSRLTDAGMVLGTAAYCAPEQAEGAPVTAMVDIYALGVVAYECLAGQRPFDGDTPVTIALKHIREDPPPLPDDIPPAVRRVVSQALSKDPARRFPTAAAMSLAARQAVATGDPAAYQADSPAQAGAALPYPMTGEIAAAPAPQPSAALPTGLPAASPATQPPVYPMTGDYRSPTGQPTEATPVRTLAEPGRGRRRAEPRRRPGRIALLAAGGVAIGAGVLAVTLTSMAQSEPPTTNVGASGKPAPSATKTTTRRTPTASSSPQRTHARGSVTETRGPSPRVTPTPTPSDSPSPQPTEEPEETSKPTGTPSVKPSTQPPKRKVPDVEYLTEEQALGVISRAGFKSKVHSVGLDEGPPTGCTQVVLQEPGEGAWLAVGRTVTISVNRRATCPSPSSSGVPTPTPHGN
ncbi:serine/threonine-protein kinase [Sinosporangium siamense]|uniref:non-specific serine/threonine protein kinase n=1 Tax=Sinosporangium siamense TaxID=1367973 RepID=A0A919REP0_9ACTN|nr:serine/threonine-protein kinase [Sinosporangium siamense]GII92503.1 hypothetical protein Ssi02_27340 [Sinosporangium siamense]